MREVTASTAAATSTPRAIPASTGAPRGLRAWDVPPKTGLAQLDALITAMTSRDTAAIEAFVVRGLTVHPCDETTTQDQATHLCAPGMPVGTPAQFTAISGQGCHGGDQRIDLIEGMPRGITVTRIAEELTRRSVSLSFVTHWKSVYPHYTLVFLEARDGSSATGWKIGVRADGAGDGIADRARLEGTGGICSGTLVDYYDSRRRSDAVLVAPPP